MYKIVLGMNNYPSKSDINPWCLIIKYPNEGVGFLERLRNTLSLIKKYVIELNVFMGYFEKGIVGVLNSLEHKQ